jgi:hypothetical protein
MSARDFDFKNVTVSAGGQIITGFADGEGVRVAMNKERASLSMGIDGEGARSKFNDDSAQITLILMQTSQSNDALSAYAKSKGTFILTIKDNNGTTIAVAATCWVRSYPEVTFGGEAGNREWVLETDAIDILVGGAS